MLERTVKWRSRVSLCCRCILYAVAKIVSKRGPWDGPGSGTGARRPGYMWSFLNYFLFILIENSNVSIGITYSSIIMHSGRQTIETDLKLTCVMSVQHLMGDELTMVGSNWIRWSRDASPLPPPSRPQVNHNDVILLTEGHGLHGMYVCMCVCVSGFSSLHAVWSPLRSIRRSLKSDGRLEWDEEEQIGSPSLPLCDLCLIVLHGPAEVSKFRADYNDELRWDEPPIDICIVIRNYRRDGELRLLGSSNEYGVTWSLTRTCYLFV